jgi:hypothetical protein
MDTFVARFFQPARLVIALGATLVVLVIAVALAVALAAGAGSINVAGADVSPFRWA